MRTRTLALFDEFARQADRAVELRLLGERAWLLTDPESCRQALAAPPHLVTRSSRYRKVSLIVGRSLLTTDGSEHRSRRRMIQPAFHQQRIRAYADAMVGAAEGSRDTWYAGRVVDMDREMAALSLAAIGTAVLGIDGRAEAARVSSALDRLQRAIALVLVPGGERLLGSRLPVLGRLRAASDELRGIAARAMSSDAELASALRDRQAAGLLSDDDVRDELLTLLLAGHETTAVTLTWAWWLLDGNREAARVLREELHRVVGDRTSCYDDVGALPFTTAVIAETLRLRPAAWIIERQVVGPLDLDGLRPPEGTVLLISPWLLHRDVASWDDPAAFRPERWLTADGRFSDEAPGQPRGAWLPFGAGAHVCIGASFAWTEAILALATLAGTWHPTAVARGDLPTRATATLRPACNVRMRVDPACTLSV